MNLGFRMHAERTPNPNCIKWVLGQAVAGDLGSASFEGVVADDVSPLAAGILEVDGTEGVYLGANFVTVTKEEEADWAELAAPIVAAIKAWAATKEPALGSGYEPPVLGEEDALVAQILAILERDIRPYVEADGGEISFAGFNDGIVEVSLQGSCAGCPNSAVTLKMGIEARLKEEIPEVKSVIAV